MTLNNQILHMEDFSGGRQVEGEQVGRRQAAWPLVLAQSLLFPPPPIPSALLPLLLSYLPFAACTFPCSLCSTFSLAIYHFWWLWPHSSPRLARQQWLQRQGVSGTMWTPCKPMGTPCHGQNCSCSRCLLPALYGGQEAFFFFSTLSEVGGIPYLGFV